MHSASDQIRANSYLALTFTPVTSEAVTTTVGVFGNTYPVACAFTVYVPATTLLNVNVPFVSVTAIFLTLSSSIRYTYALAIGVFPSCFVTVPETAINVAAARNETFDVVLFPVTPESTI